MLIGAFTLPSRPFNATPLALVSPTIRTPSPSLKDDCGGPSGRVACTEPIASSRGARASICPAERARHARGSAKFGAISAGHRLLGDKSAKQRTFTSMPRVHAPPTRSAHLHTSAPPMMCPSSSTPPHATRQLRPARAAAARPPLAHPLIMSSSFVSYLGSVACTIWPG